MVAMPRIAAVLALAAAVGLLTSCGKSPASEAGRQAQAARAHSGPARPSNGKRATAYALAVNLHHADLPGFRIAAPDKRETPREAAQERRLFHCVGGGRSAPALAEASTREYERTIGIVRIGVSSGVNVAHTAAAATRELQELRSPHTRGCLESYMRGFFRSRALRGAPVDGVSVSLGRPPSFGTTGSFAWRIKASFSVRSIHIPFYVDVLGFVYGPARVTLISSGLPTPFPAAGQEQLFSLLLGRAKAAHP
jgi:hypothetical protein